MRVTVELKGFEQVEKELKALPIRVKKQVMQTAATKASKIVVSNARAFAPVGSRIHSYYSGGQIARTFKPGNLKKSIVKLPKRKVGNAVIVGAITGKNEPYDGYYAHMVHEGTANGIRPNRFMQRAWDASRLPVYAMLKTAALQAIKKRGY